MARSCIEEREKSIPVSINQKKHYFMKKNFLAGIATLFLLNSSNAQQMIVDLSTGYNSSVPGSLIAVGGLDDTWQVKKAGTSVYVSPYVNSGWEPGYLTPGQNFNSIDGWARCISPEIYTGAPFSYGDIKQSNAGQHIYRMQFNFSKTCNTITSANLVINGAHGAPSGIITGDQVANLKLNGYSVSLPSYTPPFNYLDIYQAAQTTISSIPSKVIAISPGFFADGVNSFFITVDPTTPAGGGTGALLVDAYLEINYTAGGSNNGLFNMTGSTTTKCTSAPNGTLNVGLNVTNPNTYNLQISPSVYNGAGPNTGVQQAFLVNPAATTTYTLKITSPSGCVTSLKWPMTVASCLTTGIADEASAGVAQITVAPNPSKDVFTIQTGGLKGTASLFDLTGKLVKTVQLHEYSSEYSIDMTGFSKGMYILHLNTEAEHVTRKLILE